MRCAGQNPSGGQKGHKGVTLEQVGNPDYVIIHTPEKCDACQKSLSDVSTSTQKGASRQVFDIPEPKVEVTEHRVETKICACGQVNTGAFPDDVCAPVQYGKRISALAVYLSIQQLIPEDRLQVTFWDVFGLKISTATLVKINEGFATKIGPFMDEVLHRLKLAHVKHLDETGLRIGAKTQWLHVISSNEETHYRVSPKRGNLLEGLKGILVHDHWKPYFTLKKVKHALCNAHHLRELKAREEDKEPWAFRMSRLLRVTSGYSKTNVPEAIFLRLTRLYDKIVRQGLAFHESKQPFSKPARGRRKHRPGHNLLFRLRDFKKEVLRCLRDADVPFTNNQAEQDIRMMKVKQKISGSFRTQHGAEVFCVIRGFLSTARKQDRNLFASIKLALG